MLLERYTNEIKNKAQLNFQKEIVKSWKNYKLYNSSLFDLFYLFEKCKIFNERIDMNQIASFCSVMISILAAGEYFQYE